MPSHFKLVYPNGYFVLKECFVKSGYFVKNKYFVKTWCDVLTTVWFMITTVGIGVRFISHTSAIKFELMRAGSANENIFNKSAKGT
jgi:hypothetical protein